MLSLKKECLDRMVLFGQESLRTRRENTSSTITGNGTIREWKGRSSLEDRSLVVWSAESSAKSGWGEC